MKEYAIIEKIKSIVEEVRVAMMTTRTEPSGMRSRPMEVLKVDDDGTVWFFTDEQAGKTKTLATDHLVILSFTETKKGLYLTLYGRTYLEDDAEKMESLWNPVLNTWYPGKSKEQLVLVRFVTEKAEYWSKAKNLWEQIFYAGKAMVTGDGYRKGAHEKAQLS